MKLGEFFLNSAAIRRSPTKAVKFLAKQQDAHAQKQIVEVTALLTYLDEAERSQCERDACKFIAKEYAGCAIPDKATRAEEAFRVLALALRSSEDPSVYLVDSCDELKHALSAPTAADLYETYLAFVAEEFPLSVTTGDFEVLVEEASKKSLCDLLSERGFGPILRALPSLAARFGTLPTRT